MCLTFVLGLPPFHPRYDAPYTPPPHSFPSPSTPHGLISMRAPSCTAELSHDSHVGSSYAVRCRVAAVRQTDRTVVVQVGSLVVLAVWYTLFSSPLVGLLPFLSCLPHPDSSMGAADGRREECEACMGICVWGYVSTRIPRIRSRHTLLYLLRPIMDSIPVAPLPMPPRLAGKTPGFGDRLPSRSPKFMIAAPRPSSPLCL